MAFDGGSTSERLATRSTVATVRCWSLNAAAACFSCCTRRQLSGSLVNGNEYHFSMVTCNVGSRRHVPLELQRRIDADRQHCDNVGHHCQSDGSNQLHLHTVCVDTWSELTKQYGVVCRFDR